GAAAWRGRELAAIPPGSVAAFDLRCIDAGSTDAHQRVADDAALRRELLAILDVLNLAAAAAIDHIVWTARIHTCGRRLEQLDECPAHQPTLRNRADPREIAGRCSRDEHHHAFVPPDAIAA